MVFFIVSQDYFFQAYITFSGLRIYSFITSNLFGLDADCNELNQHHLRLQDISLNVLQYVGL